MSNIDLGIVLPKIKAAKKKTHLDKLLIEVAKKHNLTVFKLKGSSRKAELVKARADFITQALSLVPEPSQTEIANRLDRHPSSIHYYINDYIKPENL